MSDYQPSREVKSIHENHESCISNILRFAQEDMDRWQLDLLYCHLPNMDSETEARARQTIKTLEKRITANDYRYDCGRAL